MVKHTGEKPHACAFCPAAFSQKGNLQSHVQRVHSEVSPAQALGSRGPCGGGRWTRPGLVTTPGLQFASSRCSPAGPFQARRPSCTHECRWPGDMRTAWCWGGACICKRPPAGSTGSMDGERAPLTAPHRPSPPPAGRRPSHSRSLSNSGLAAGGASARQTAVSCQVTGTESWFLLGASLGPESTVGFQLLWLRAGIETRAAELEPSPLQAKAMLKG